MGSTTTTTAGTTRPTQPTAQEALAGFFTSAVTLDTQLHDAATAINGSGPPWPTVTDETATRIEVPAEVAAKVQAAELAPVAEAIPAGMPRDLLQSVILVYSDLSSRRHAMDDFSDEQVAATEGDEDAVEYMQRQTLERLGGAAPQRPVSTTTWRRLDRWRHRHHRSPPLDSRLAAERALLIDYVEGANTTCGGTGVVVVAELPTIDWAPGTRDGIPVDGNRQALGSEYHEMGFVESIDELLEVRLEQRGQVLVRDVSGMDDQESARGVLEEVAVAEVPVLADDDSALGVCGGGDLVVGRAIGVRALGCVGPGTTYPPSFGGLVWRERYCRGCPRSGPGWDSLSDAARVCLGIGPDSVVNTDGI